MLLDWWRLFTHLPASSLNRKIGMLVLWAAAMTHSTLQLCSPAIALLSMYLPTGLKTAKSGRGLLAGPRESLLPKQTSATQPNYLHGFRLCSAAAAVAALSMHRA
jgi:hypothetical protein